MTTDLKKGKILDSGFEILDVKELEEFEAAGIWARHQKSGAEVFHILNDDSENLFSFAFATPPGDSTGAAHILEHSVLCGSKSYPLKDAFLVLAQGSLQTFLNAWTFPDKTLYPASSVNEQDYFNLMSVYGDAVFRPLLSEWTFMQEGHRLVFGDEAREAPDGNRPPEESQSKENQSNELKITGVVYNEMKGAYSSLDAYAGLWSVKAVLPGTPYDFESGGDPENIPDLSWEGLKAFHRAWYAPANCRVFLAGNIPTEKQLAFLNEKFFSALPPGERAAPIPKARRWESPRSFRIPCPAGAEQKPTVLLSWLCGDAASNDETLGLAALAEILLGHDGSPLTRALIDSGLGEDLSPVSGLESELRETAFCAGLRGAGSEAPGESIGECAKKIEALILDELERLVREGIPEEEKEAALLGMEFSQREIRRSGGPFSLVWMRRSLRAWLHGGNPWDSLLFAPALAELKRRSAEDKRYFEKMVSRYLLDNPHRAFIIVEPKEGFQEEKDAVLNRRLEKIEATLSAADRKALDAKNRELTMIQEEPDSPEALAAIPHLSRRDLSPEIEIVPRQYLDASGVPVLAHPLFTNGITYADLAFPADILDAEDYYWLPFFSRAIVSMGLPGMDYGEVSSLLARTAGGFHATLQSSSPVPGSGKAVTFPSGVYDLRGRDWIVYRVKALDEKIGASLDIARRLIHEADFTDLRRIHDLALEMKNDVDSSLAPSGHSYASGRSGRDFSVSRRVDEIWSGIDQLKFVHSLAALPAEEQSRRLAAIRDKLVSGGLVVNLCAGASSVGGALKAIAGRFGSLGAPRPRQTPILPPEKPASAPEVFASPSLQVGFAAATLHAAPFGSPGQSAELVLSHLLSTGALWEDIRMKGGAYGAFAQPDSLEGTFSFSTYRDPNPLRSLEIFSAVPGTFTGYSGDTLDKAVIGSYGRETRPRTSAEKSLADFSRLLYGIEDSHRSQRLAALINTNEEEISRALQRLAAAPAPTPVIIAGVDEAEKAAAALGVNVEVLPA